LFPKYFPLCKGGWRGIYKQNGDGGEFQPSSHRGEGNKIFLTIMDYLSNDN